MNSEVPGINRWIAGVRYRMENDPGRQDLDDHILCNGFLFLDEYLEDILMGARTEPIIELTKTPGRRKDMSKKVRSATAVAVKMLPLELGSPDKERAPFTKSTNVKKAPTSFQSALLEASKENRPPDLEGGTTRFYDPSQSDPRSPFGPALQSKHQHSKEAEAVETFVIPPLVHVAPKSPLDGTAQSLLVAQFVKESVRLSDGVVSAHQEDVDHPSPELSIIPEGDEIEVSRVSLSSRPNPAIVRDKEILYSVPKENGPVATLTVSYDPSADDDDDIQTFQTPDDRSFNDSEPTSTASSFPIDPYARDYETHELRYLMGAEQPSEPALPPQSDPAHSLVRKASVPVFPSLPGPSPLRKSTHEFSGSSQGVSNTRPSVVAGSGTRTSWLNRARDVTAKRTSVVAGVKRKSVEPSGERSPMTLDDVHARPTKVAKTSSEGGVTDLEEHQSKMSIQPFRPVVPARSREQPVGQVALVATPDSNSEGMMNILKRTVEGLGARVGKSMGKSLGGAAATAAAAEAKAAAEARLAQREAKGSDGNGHGRLSVSDLISAYDGGKGRGKEPEPIQGSIGHAIPPAPDTVPELRTSISTTPPDSPPAIHKSPSLASTAPGSITGIIPKFTVQRHIPPEPSFTLPDSLPSTQSTYVSSIFDDHSAWQPSSQTTEFTASQGHSQPEAQLKEFALTRDYAASALFKEVDGTNKQPIKSVWNNQTTNVTQERDESTAHNEAIQGDGSLRVPGAFEPEDEDMALTDNILHGMDVESEEEITAAMGRSMSDYPSDTDMTKNKDASSQPSSQTGFVAQASGLLSKVIGVSVGNALGTSKRGKPEPLKSIQLAAAAAKKQQEEADRKAARLREMDKRRAAIASKKAEHEAAEKAKQQAERRKREREEGPEKKVTRAAVKKVEDDVKKRKVAVEIEKKSVSKDKKDMGGSRIGKPVPYASQTQLGQSTLSKSFKPPGLPASAPQSTVKLIGSTQGEPKVTPGLPKPASIKEKPAQRSLEDVRQPSQTLHAQMQARVEAQLLQARLDEPIVPSESIELPDINSEYSNSDDEDRPRTFDPPGWAQSPDLRLALESQSRMNPDDIFGPVRPLRMEEIFPTRQSRFRARTSSANWAGTDEVTRDEEVQYARRMGYR